MTTKTFVAYLVAASSVAVLSIFFLPDANTNGHAARQTGSSTNALLTALPGHVGAAANDRVWPALEPSWRIAVATLVGFLGSAFGTVGGVGGGGIFVPMLNLVVGFDTKSAAALSKCMIMGASMSSVWYNLRVSHPIKGDDAPIIDYDLALLFQPMLMLGITIGVSLSVVFPYWLITVLIIILFIGTSSRSFCRAIWMWREETLIKKEMQARLDEAAVKLKPGDRGDGSCHDVVVVDSIEEPLLPRHHEKTKLEVICSNIRWGGLGVLVLVWICFLLLQTFKSSAPVCGPIYWGVNILQFPVAISVFAWEAVKLYRRSKAQRAAVAGGCAAQCVCEASIEWGPSQLLFCALCGILGGTVGGLLGSGGGFILGPLLLEIGVIPQVASATATFVMMFSSSLSVVEFYFLDRFPIPYALYLMSVSVLAGFWGQCFVRRLVHVLKRASIIIFILSSVIFASALTMGVIGTEKSISMIRDHEYMGFLSFCDN